MIRKTLLAVLVTCILAASYLPGVATAQERYGVSGPVDLGGLTVWGILAQYGRWSGFGVGVHYMIPIGDGVLTNTDVKDRFGLEFGADLTNYVYRYDDRVLLRNPLRIRPAIGFLWTFWLIDELALYPKIDVGFPIFLVGDYADPWLMNLSAGLLYRLDDFDLRVEAGRYGLHVGALFRL